MTHRQPTMRPNYISQDKNEGKPNHRSNTKLRTTSIMQEAMLACIDITKPTFKISAAKLATRKFPLIWLCKMANSVIGKQGELLEYHHLMRIPRHGPQGTTLTAMSLDSWHKECWAKMMGTDTIIFIPKVKVPRARAKDITYGLITYFIRPEKTGEPNRTRLVAGGDRVHYLFDAGTPTANLLTVKLLVNCVIFTPKA